MYGTYDYVQEISGLKEFKLPFLNNRTVTQMAEQIHGKIQSGQVCFVVMATVYLLQL